MYILNILSEYLVIRSCIASLFRHVNLILWKEKCILGENWLIFFGILGEAELILRIWGAKEKYFQGAEACIIFRDQGSIDPLGASILYEPRHEISTNVAF